MTDWQFTWSPPRTVPRGVLFWPDPPKPRLACQCDDPDSIQCLTHVRCDAGCKALREPKDDPGQLKAALLHWRDHALLYGCSHGA